MKVPVRGGYALIDDGDLPLMDGYDWWVSRRRYTNSNASYVMGTTGRMGKLVYLHRIILGLKTGDGVEVDHINNDGCDNRRTNLRTVTHTHNLANMVKVRGTSRYKGVHWARNEGKWHSNISYNDKTVPIGYFDSEEDAARAYNRKAVELYGGYARINVIAT